jgi:Protein of unknown function (DUF2934)
MAKANKYREFARWIGDRETVRCMAEELKQRGRALARPNEDRIRTRAWEIWEENGRPTGRDEEFWFQAEREQERGEVASVDDGRRSSKTEDLKPIVPDVGLTHKEIHEARIIRDAEKESPGIVRQTLAEQTPVDAPADAENLAMRAEQAKSLLAGLGLDTAIRLRWAMRDIRAKRTKSSPVRENDLAALIDLGFVEMREGTPRLTGLGVLALD